MSNIDQLRPRSVVGVTYVLLYFVIWIANLREERKKGKHQKMSVVVRRFVQCSLIGVARVAFGSLDA